MTQQDTHELIIVGGGIVGAALACLAARPGPSMRIALVEARPEQPFDPAVDVDLRVSAVSRAAQYILSACGAWPAIRDARISPYREMRVWDAHSRPYGRDAIHFDSADLGQPDLGHIIENRLIQTALLDVLKTLPAVEVLQPVAPAAIDFEAGCVGVTLDDGRRLSARLVIGADGSQSLTRRLAGLGTRGWTYHQAAIVSHVHTRLPHAETAWQRFLPGGPLALLPLADGRSSVVWSAPETRARELLEMDTTSFCSELGEASDFVLGSIADAGPRASFPLQASHAPAYVRARCALIGDAAHVVHPLAGQGANLGLLDAAALAQQIRDAVESGEDPGDTATLRRYERWRKGHNLAMLMALDGIHRLFGSELAPLGFLRRLGLATVAGPLKRRLARRAMGLDGDLPRCARRETVPVQSVASPAPLHLSASE